MFFKIKNSNNTVAVSYNKGFVLIDKTKLLEHDPKNSKFYVIRSYIEHQNGIIEKKYHFIKLKHFKNVAKFKEEIDDSISVIGIAIPEYYENGKDSRVNSMTVVQRIRSLKYPRGGLIGIRRFTEDFINDDNVFLGHKVTNVKAQLMGNTIECLAKVEQGVEVEKSFS